MYFGISKFILQFLYYFHAPCIVLFTVYFHLQCNVLSTVYFHTVFPCSSFFVTDSIRKQTLLTERFNFVFIKNLSSASQSNKQVVMAESQEQYILSNITYIKFRNFYFFYFFVYLEGDAPEMYTKHLKDICNGVHFFLAKLQVDGRQLYQKYVPLQIFSKIFAQIYSFLYRVPQNFTNFCFPENILVVAFRGRRLQSEKT